jgi:hypothetical protein
MTSNEHFNFVNPRSIAASLVSDEYHQYGSIDLELADECGEYHYDPLGWVMWAFDWGHGELEGFDGPDEWQKNYLDDLGNQLRARAFDGVAPALPVRKATASGHGIGKSALVAWVILFIMSTRPQSKGIVTANTGDQLKTKTWGELGKWRSRCIVGHWFEYNSGKGSLSLYHKSWPETWRVDGQTCREENSESFAGLHAASATPFYIFDEASAVPNKIWEVAEGGLTDGQPIFLAFGNPTRNSGKFKDCFTRNKRRWTTAQIDSRHCKMTNKSLIDEWLNDHGEDSDFFRVRVRGIFPSAGENQFFASSLVAEAMKAPIGRYLGDDALICGIDLARGGNDDCMIVFRRGKDARSETTYRIPPEKSKDSMKVASIIAMLLDQHDPDVCFLDVTGIGGPIGDRLRQLGYHVIDVGFGHVADDQKYYANKTAEMAARLKEWMMSGGALPNNPELEEQLTTRDFWHNSKDQLVLEPKKEQKSRLGISPDWADALKLTFAQPVPRRSEGNLRGMRDVAPHARGNMGGSLDYDPLDNL